MSAAVPNAGVPSARVRWARRTLAVAAWLFVAGVLAQALTAGRAAFVGPQWWVRHRDLVHTFEWLSPLAVVLAYLGRAPGATKWLAWLTVAGLMLQYVTAGLRSSPSLLMWAALHAVSALLLAWVAVELARHATRVAREREGR
jgi:hypothetical protein